MGRTFGSVVDEPLTMSEPQKSNGSAFPLIGSLSCLCEFVAKYLPVNVVSLQEWMKYCKTDEAEESIFDCYREKGHSGGRKNSNLNSELIL